MAIETLLFYTSRRVFVDWSRFPFAEGIPIAGGIPGIPPAAAGMPIPGTAPIPGMAPAPMGIIPPRAAI
jgi:hypothetical protein